MSVPQSKGLHFCQTRSNAIILYNTLPALCTEKVVVMKSGEELHSKTYQSPIAPQRVVLKPNLNYERQDTASSDARKSFDYSDKHGGTYRETCRGEINFRIQGLLHSAVQEHDHIRKQAVQKLIHQFENHPNKGALQADLQQNRAFNPFSEQSKEMIYSMGNMEPLRDLRDHSQHSIHQLYDILAERYCILNMPNMPTTFTQIFENLTVTATMFCQYPIMS